MMARREPGEGRYARLEREQRWLLRGVPEGAVTVSSIEDRYIRGTRLRIRRMEASGEVAFKLGQKVRRDGGDPEIVKLTNIYLSSDEHAVLVALASAVVLKTRWSVTTPAGDIAADEFHGRWQGLVLAEVELGEDDEARSAPVPAIEEVTHDDRFSGGSLAFVSDGEARSLLDEVGRRVGRFVGPHRSR
jgi:CYTH domain-containing protein